jgi:hypothetical protein
MRALVLAILLTLSSTRALAQANDVDEIAPPPRPSQATAGLRETGEPILEPPVAFNRSHPVRAVALAGLAFSVNLAWYWWDVNFNSPDWDLRWDWPSWKKKIITFQAVRLDSNHFSTNAGSHTEGGMLVYLIGRGSGLSVGYSTLLAFGEVVLWEFVGEFYEKPSINDLINNPIGGLAVGEPFHQLSMFFSRGADNGINPILATIFSPIAHANAFVDNVRPRRAGEIDRLGLPADVWHRFDIYSGGSDVRFSDQFRRFESLLGIRTQLNTVGGYGRPVPRSGGFGAARVTQIDAAVGFGAQEVTGTLFATRVALAGYHHQNLHRIGDEIAGQNLLFTLDNTFDYSMRRRPGLSIDQIATFGLVGPMLELSQRQGPFEAALHLQAVPELAMVTSLAADAYKASFGTEGLKSTVAEHGYYYAYGATLGAQLALRFHFAELGGDARWERFGSIEGYDRFQERLTRDFHQQDGRSRVMAWLSLRMRSFADLGLSLERNTRWGQMTEVRVTSVERRATMTLSFRL